MDEKESLIKTSAVVNKLISSAAFSAWLMNIYISLTLSQKSLLAAVWALIWFNGVFPFSHAVAIQKSQETVVSLSAHLKASFRFLETHSLIHEFIYLK